MEEEIHGGLHAGEKENNQRRKMSDELRPCPFCGGPATRNDEEGDPDELYLSCMSIQCCGGEWWFKPYQWQSRPIESALESRLKIAVEALEEISRNQYISAIVDEVARDALAKIRS